MTGVANRRHFDNYIMKEWKRGLREQTPVTPIDIDIDIDFLKQFNDICGHLAGDECIQKVVKRLESTLRRSNDILARDGGEEFAIIAPTA